MAIEVDSEGLATAEIDGETYHFTKWGAIDSTRVLAKLLSVAKGFLAASAAGGTAAPGEKKRVRPEIIEALLDGIGSDEERVLTVLQSLCADQRMRCNFKVIDFDKHYKGRPMHMLKVAKASAEVQFGNFFEDALKLGGASEQSPET